MVWGSLLSGWLSDRVSPRRILTILPLLGTAALLALSGFSGQTLVFLGIVDFAYGGTIATYPAANSLLFPSDASPLAYGRIFTAWGLAGLLPPWFAGQIYDWTQSYTPALWVAAVLSVLSAITAQKYIQRA
jgi:OFA family oxalate/formate antiporter-like MFS transporter